MTWKCEAIHVKGIKLGGKMDHAEHRLARKWPIEIKATLSLLQDDNFYINITLD